MIAGLTSKGKVFLWDTHSGNRLAEIPIDGRPVSDIVFSKSEFLLAVTYLDGFIEIYEVMER
jgi:WD40 repeat protein